MGCLASWTVLQTHQSKAGDFASKDIEAGKYHQGEDCTRAKISHADLEDLEMAALFDVGCQSAAYSSSQRLVNVNGD